MADKHPDVLIIILTDDGRQIRVTVDVSAEEASPADSPPPMVPAE